MNRFITMLILISGIGCVGQSPYDDLGKLSPDAFHKAVADSIEKVEDAHFGNFVYHIQKVKQNAFKGHEKAVLDQMKRAEYGYQIAIRLDILIELGYDKKMLETVLFEKQSVWDKGNWAGKVWKRISDAGLHVRHPDYYKVDSQGVKTYDVKMLIASLTSDDAIGENPLLSVDYRRFGFKPGELLRTLESMKIRDIWIVKTRVEAPKLYGASGKDGMLEVLTFQK